jgi:hypothetical protein
VQFTILQEKMWKVGMKVFLKKENNIVAEGIIEDVDPKNICRCLLLGNKHVAVHVNEVFDAQVMLIEDPYLDFLNEAKGITISWMIDELEEVQGEYEESQCINNIRALGKVNNIVT